MDIYLDSFWQEGTSFQRGMADFRYIYWGEYYNSLLFVKNKYDPNNVFRFEQSVSPFPDHPGVRTTDEPSMFSDPIITYEPWSKSFV